MSYAMTSPRPGLGIVTPTTTYVQSDTSTGDTLLVGIIVVGVFGLIGLLIYEGMKTQRQIVHEQGVGKALEYQGGMAAIGVLSQAMTRSERE